MDAGEVEEIGILEVAHRPVGIGGHDVIGVQHGERGAAKPF